MSPRVWGAVDPAGSKSFAKCCWKCASLPAPAASLLLHALHTPAEAASATNTFQSRQGVLLQKCSKPYASNLLGVSSVTCASPTCHLFLKHVWYWSARRQPRLVCALLQRVYHRQEPLLCAGAEPLTHLGHEVVKHLDKTSTGVTVVCSNKMPLLYKNASGWGR